jgi:hypothetical protein
MGADRARFSWVIIANYSLSIANCKLRKRRGVFSLILMVEEQSAV